MSRVEIATTPEAREAIYRFRYAVYVEEMGKNPSYARHERKQLTDELDARATLLFVQDAGHVVATLRILFADEQAFPEHYQELYDLAPFVREVGPRCLSFTSRFMIARGQRHQGLLATLAASAYELYRRHGTEFDFLQCRPALIPLYERMGYRRYRSSVADPDAGFQVPMTFAVHDLERMRLTSSPYLPAAEAGAQHGHAAGWFRALLAARRMDGAPRTALDDAATAWEQGGDPAAGERALFAACSADEVRQVLELGTVLELAPGDRILRNGDFGEELYFVLSGGVVVTRQALAGAHRLAELGPGSVFGEVALAGKGRRTADVSALTEARVLMLNKTTLAKLRRASPDLAARLLENLTGILAERLAAANERWLESTNALQWTQESEG